MYGSAQAHCAPAAAWHKYCLHYIWLESHIGVGNHCAAGVLHTHGATLLVAPRAGMPHLPAKALLAD